MPDFKNTRVEDFIAASREANLGESFDNPMIPEPRDHVQLGRLSITHDAVMDYLLANPGRGQMGKCADYFGFTRAWLSSMVWSDAFQAKLRDKQELMFEGTVIPMRDQMNGVAQRALERLGEKVEIIQDPKILSDVADKLLHRLGYAPKVDSAPGVNNTNTQNNFYAVSPELLAQARENAKKGDSYARPTPALPSAAGLQAYDESDLGEIPDGDSILCLEEEKGN